MTLRTPKEADTTGMYGLKQSLMGRSSGEIPKDVVIPRSKSETESSISVAEYRDANGNLVYMYDSVEVPNTTVYAAEWRDRLVLDSSDSSIKIDGNNTTKGIDFTINTIVSGSVLDTELNTGTIRRLATSSAINVLVTGTHTLYTVPTGRSAVITAIYARVTSYDGTDKTTDVTFNMGGNSADFDDWVDGVSYPTTTAVTVFEIAPVPGTAVAYYTAGYPFTFNVVTASDGVTEQWTLETFGYLI
jgi:hypothetical protein